MQDAFGADVALSGKLLLVSAPRKGITGNGAVFAFVRSDSWVELAEFVGSDTDEGDFFGEALDLEGSRIVVGAPEEDWDVEGNGSLPAPGEVSVFELLSSTPPEAYCTAGTTASGCQTSLSSVGVPSASMSEGFLLAASGVEGEKDGLFFIGTNGRQANPWGNGTSLQCVVPPTVRTGLLMGSGSSGSCKSSFARDLNSFWTEKPVQNPGVGAVVQAQLWHRDPQNTSNQTTSLSGALEFTVSP